MQKQADFSSRFRKGFRRVLAVAFLAYIAVVFIGAMQQPYAQAIRARVAQAQANGEPTSRVATIHTVQRGDILVRLAAQYGVTVESIIVVNALQDPNELVIGQTLIIPLRGFPSLTPSPIPPTYTTAPTATASPSPTPLPTATPFTPSPTLLPSPTPELLPTLELTVESFPAEVSPESTEPNPFAPTAQNLLNTLTSTPTPLPPAPTDLNGIPIEQFVVMPPNVVENVRTIYALGQTLGNNPNAFSKIGDSTIESPFFMDRFDGLDRAYNLGAYWAFQPTIDHFYGSFARDSIAVRIGLHSWTIFDPMWSDPAWCDIGETLIACEYRIHRPSYVFIRLGANDAGVPEYFEENMRQIVQYSIENGVVPILGTKADRNEGGDNLNNGILRRIATDFAIPLWDFDLLAGTIPGRGLIADGVHMTTWYAHDWSQPGAFGTGQGVHTLGGLIALDRVWRATAGE